MDFVSESDYFFNTDLMTSALQHNYIPAAISVAYILFTTMFGPIIMKHQKPMELKSIIILFNFVLVAINVYSFVEFSRATWTFWPERCNLRNSSNFNKYVTSYQVGLLLWLFSRFAELFDTVFFVLRKKFNQITLLNVFHHSAFFSIAWYVLQTRDIGFYSLVLCTLNTFVHTIMYSYYFMAAFGPQMRNYLWWKKYLTTIQIIQFLLIFTYLGIGLLTGCEKFGVIESIIFGGNFAVMVMFFQFYYKAYRKK